MPVRLVASAVLLVANAGAPAAPPSDALPARPLGPATPGGRVTDVAAVDARTFYVATAGAGLWKTTDGGDTLAPVSDAVETLSIGAVAFAPSKPDVVYLGTGEVNPRNSVSWGKGLFKSTDAGRTWTAVGLADTRHVGRVVVHPADADTVYVAALGHLWGPNEERGVFKSADGGKTWTKSLFLDENTGVVDLAIDPSDPDTLYAAAYPCRRDAFAGGAPKSQWGPTGGLHKTTDGGKTWAKLAGGLPERDIGRCGVAVWAKDPNVVYAVVQTDKTAGPADNVGQVAKANAADIDRGGVFRSDDKGKTWKKLNDLVPRPFYYGQVRIDPADDKRIYVLGIAFHISDDGGKTFQPPGKGFVVHSDHHALWIDPADTNRLVLGNDGGVYVSKTKGRTFEKLFGLCAAQFYGVAVDLRKPYRVYGGLQDNANYGGPSATDRAEGILPTDWKRVGGNGDGFQTQVDPTDPDTVYAETQYGRPVRLNVKAGTSKDIRPPVPKGAEPHRFNWNAPLALSPHDPKTLYFGGEVLFRSADRGDTWSKISPDLSRAKAGAKLSLFAHTLTTVAESPVKAGVIWAGSDDGKVSVSADAGKTWTDVSDNVPGVPAARCVSRVECSHFDENAAYVALDRHRNDDAKPYLFKTTDLGKTWTPLAAGLPQDGPVLAVRESSKNADVLFAGTEFGLFASIDAGRTWSGMANGLPPGAAAADLVVHPRDRELVVGTHGRGVYVIDIAPLEELTEKARGEAVHLCDIKPATLVALKPAEKRGGRTPFVGRNPPRGAVVWYHLKDAAAAAPRLTIADADGNEAATLTGPKGAGLHRLVWDFATGKGEAAAGTYRATLTVGEAKITKALTVERPAD